MNARLWESAQARSCCTLKAPQIPTSSKVRGEASIMLLDHGLQLKSLRIGYAPSEGERREHLHLRGKARRFGGVLG